MLELVLASGRGGGLAGVLPRYISRRWLLVICFSARFTGRVTGSSPTLDTLVHVQGSQESVRPDVVALAQFNSAVPKTKRSRFESEVSGAD